MPTHHSLMPANRLLLLLLLLHLHLTRAAAGA